MPGGALERRRAKSQDETKNLPHALELAIGMKVMLTDNIETELDMANGARGEVVDIVLHPDEPAYTDEAVAKLKYIPLFVLVKLNQTRASTLEGLDQVLCRLNL